MPRLMIGEIFPLIGTTKQVVIDQNAEVVCGAIGVGESSFLGSLSPELREIGIQSFIAVPVKANNETTGILQIHSLERDIYEDQHVRLLHTIADQIAGAISNSQLYRERTQAEASQRRLAEENAVIADIGRIISSSAGISEFTPDLAK